MRKVEEAIFDIAQKSTKKFEKFGTKVQISEIQIINAKRC